MSEIKVNKISPATSTDITLGDSGDTFTVPSGATIVNSGTATGFGGGKIGQVVQTLRTDTETTTSSSFVTMNFAVTITPTATDSKILLSANFGSINPKYSGQFVHVKIDGGNCATYIGDAALGYESAMTSIGTYDDYTQQSCSLQYLDSPATTSATTYTLYWHQGGGTSAWLNRCGTLRAANGNTASTFVAMEVLA